MVVRSRIPSPPSSTGRVTFDHATRHLPPETTSVPIQRKALQIFSMDLMA